MIMLETLAINKPEQKQKAKQLRFSLSNANDKASVDFLDKLIYIIIILMCILHRSILHTLKSTLLYLNY